jgi:hypothetical protein
MIDPKCFMCNEELNEPGAILWGPPLLIPGEKDCHRKYHFCVSCFTKLLIMRLKRRQKKNR